MATDANPGNPNSPGGQAAADHHHGVRIFTYPKIIFIWPTFIAALICAIGMAWIRNETRDPKKVAEVGQIVEVNDAAADGEPGEPMVEMRIPKRFNSAQNLFAVFFLGVFAFNMIVMALDFPRFTIIGGFLLVLAVISLLGWLSLYFGFEVMRPLVRGLEGIFVVANGQFYALIAGIIGLTFGLILATRYLDFWEVRPNEILHHHGPLSDLERYPTLNLKFDKEIPDVLEYLMLGAGRLVLRVPSENRAIVLDNVLWISDKEQRLKSLMSRMEVRITTDQEAVEP